ncbi:MAG TPA: DUF882 domain-containing protein [Gemmatimonadales bacterium]|nr:DUF882 domain-containing protein [Gemmatimonadales bacterium]
MSSLLLDSEPHAVTRRRFVASLAVAGLGLVKLPRLLGAMEAPRDLAFHHLHTGERLSVEYFSGGEYLPHALHEVNHVLRDWRTNELYPIDPALLDLLHALRAATGTRQPFDVICGYRCPATNAMLASHSEGVSPRSLHLKGKAIDIRLSDVPLAKLRDAALGLRRGGVGYYPDAANNFVHVDTGRVRRW